MRFVKGHLHSFLALLGALILGSCGSSKFPGGELVMFTAFGPHAFEGRVLVMRPDGSGLTTVLAPQTLLGYEGAYGNSLRKFILVSVAQSTGGDSDVVNINRYTPLINQFLPLQQQLPLGGEGAGVPSPDNSKFVAIMSPPGQPSAVNLWLSDFGTKQFRQLTNNPALTQDNNPTWSPDGQQIVFVRVVFPPAPFSTQLLAIPGQGGRETVLLGPSDGVGEAAFSPDGRKLVFNSVNGMEIMHLNTLNRIVILTLGKVYGGTTQRYLSAVGMSWAKTTDRIVFALQNFAAQREELWIVSSDGSNLQNIFTADAGVTILSVTLIRN